mmetsp:Transcript_107595/g.213758  ORF Transcript_107595/g.213758 Transcript_107595/m.213758 type:complete len:462 (+) Transcript_107595:33-1418(+)
MSRSLHYTDIPSQAETPESPETQRSVMQRISATGASSFPYVHDGDAHAGAPTPVPIAGGVTPVTDLQGEQTWRSAHSNRSLQPSRVTQQTDVLDASGLNLFARHPAPPHSVSVFEEIEGPRLHLVHEDPMEEHGLPWQRSDSVQEGSLLSLAHSERVVVDAGLPPSRSSTPHVDAPMGAALPTLPILGSSHLAVGTDVPMDTFRLAPQFTTPPVSPMLAAAHRRVGLSAPPADHLSDTLWSFADANVPSVLGSELMASAGFSKREVMDTQWSEPPATQERPPITQERYQADARYPAVWKDDELHIGRLESTYVHQQGAQMSHQLSILEQIAANVVTVPDSLDDWDPCEEPAWRAGTREWRAKYMSEPLNGFWIDKTCIAEREQHLLELCEMDDAGDKHHSIFRRIAGVPAKKKQKYKEALDGMLWRGLSNFAEVDDDDFVFRGGGKKHRSFAAQPEQVLTF